MTDILAKPSKLLWIWILYQCASAKPVTGKDCKKRVQTFKLHATGYLFQAHVWNAEDLASIINYMVTANTKFAGTLLSDADKASLTKVQSEVRELQERMEQINSLLPDSKIYNEYKDVETELGVLKSKSLIHNLSDDEKSRRSSLESRSAELLASKGQRNKGLAELLEVKLSLSNAKANERFYLSGGFEQKDAGNFLDFLNDAGGNYDNENTYYRSWVAISKDRKSLVKMDFDGKFKEQIKVKDQLLANFAAALGSGSGKDRGEIIRIDPRGFFECRISS